MRVEGAPRLAERAQHAALDRGAVRRDDADRCADVVKRLDVVGMRGQVGLGELQCLGGVCRERCRVFGGWLVERDVAALDVAEILVDRDRAAAEDDVQPRGGGQRAMRRRVVRVGASAWLNSATASG